MLDKEALLVIVSELYLNNAEITKIYAISLQFIVV